MRNVLVSIIIATVGRHRLLEKTLKSLKIQTFRNFELILVCVKIDKQLKEIAEKYEAYLFEDQGLGRCYARNVGIRKAKGKIIVFLDDDVKLGKNWLESVVRDFRLSHKVGGVGGMPISINDNGIALSNYKLRVQKTIYHLMMSNSHRLCSWTNRPKYKARVDTLPGCNMAFSSEILLKVGMFDENFYGPSTAEDIDLCLRVRDKGYYLVFDPEAKVYHHTSYRKIDPNLFLATVDNETYCRVKNLILTNPIMLFIHILYNFLYAFLYSLMRVDPRYVSSCFLGVLRGYRRARAIVHACMPRASVKIKERLRRLGYI